MVATANDLVRYNKRRRAERGGRQDMKPQENDRLNKQMFTLQRRSADAT